MSSAELGDDQQVVALIERLLVDGGFRAEFRRDPVGVCERSGLVGLADELRGRGRVVQTLELRESKSSLAGVVLAVAAEGIGAAELGGLLHHGLPHGAQLKSLEQLKHGKLKTPRLPHSASAALKQADHLSASARRHAAQASAVGDSAGAKSATGPGSASAPANGRPPAGGGRPPAGGGRPPAGGAGHAVDGATKAGGHAGTTAGARDEKPMTASAASGAQATPTTGAASSSATATDTGSGGHPAAKTDTGSGGHHAGGDHAAKTTAPAGGVTGTVKPLPDNTATGSTATTTTAATATGSTGATAAGSTDPTTAAPAGSGAASSVANTATAAGSGVGSAGVGSAGMTASASELLSSPNLSASAAVDTALSAQTIDPRLVSVLSDALSHHKITVGAIDVTQTPIHAQGLDITAVDGQPVSPSNIGARDLLTEIAAMDPSQRPNEIGSPWAIQSPGFYTDTAHQNKLSLGFASTGDYTPQTTTATTPADITPTPTGPTAADPAAAGAAQAADQALQPAPVQPVEQALQPSPTAATSTTGATGQSVADGVTAGGGTLSAASSEKLAAMVKEADSLLGDPYIYGGGHAGWAPSSGYDCSGFVSAVLHAGGFLTEPVDTTALPDQPGILAGPGQLVTIYDRSLPGENGHVIIDINGQFYESGGEAGAWGGGGGVEKIGRPSAAYLATFDDKLHPKGL